MVYANKLNKNLLIALNNNKKNKLYKKKSISAARLENLLYFYFYLKLIYHENIFWLNLEKKLTNKSLILERGRKQKLNPQQCLFHFILSE